MKTPTLKDTLLHSRSSLKNRLFKSKKIYLQFFKSSHCRFLKSMLMRQLRVTTCFHYSSLKLGGRKTIRTANTRHGICSVITKPFLNFFCKQIHIKLSQFNEGESSAIKPMTKFPLQIIYLVLRAPANHTV